MKTIRVMGIDPGIKGAFCVLELKLGQKPTLITIKDFPLMELKRANGTAKIRLDLPSLAFSLDMFSSNVGIALIEDVGAMTTQADPIRMFTFGFATGAVHGILGSIGIKVEAVRPEIWKAMMGLSKDKQRSFDLALKLYPEAAKYLTLKKHDGRAEALLLAHFAATNLKIRR